MPRVSVIIPNYNHAQYLPQRIDSVLAQTFTDFEVLLLDDCSSDDSRSIIESYRGNPRVTHVLLNERNSGSTFIQWQKGLEHASGDWIWIAESDDLCEPGMLERLLAPDVPDACGMRYCVSETIDSDGALSGQLSPVGLPGGSYKGIDFLYDRLLDINMVPNASGVVVRKSILAKALDENIAQFRLVGDWLVWCLIALKSDVYFTNAVRNFHRHHNATVREQFGKDGRFFGEHNSFRDILAEKFKGLPATEAKRLMERNIKFRYRDEGSKGCYLVRKKKYRQSLAPLLRATFFPTFTLYYLRSAAYWLFNSEQRNPGSDGNTTGTNADAGDRS